MGMAASQVRFLQLTGRKNDIGRELQHLSLEKMSLAREMQKISKNYNESLSAKVMKWSNNNGVTYTDLSYSTLMRPGAANNNKPIMLTDSSERIVLDSKYEKYAKMLSPNGSSGATWNGDGGEPRATILAELTGIDAEKIKAYSETNQGVKDAQSARTSAKKALDSWKSKETSRGRLSYLTVDKFADKMGTVNGSDLSKMYTKEESISIKSTSDLQTLVDGIYNNMSKYFFGVEGEENALNLKDKTHFKNACDAAVQQFTAYLNLTGDNADKQREAAGISGSAGDWKINVNTLFKCIMNTYGSSGSVATSSKKEETYAMRDTTSGSDWDNWYKELESLNTIYEESETAYASACESDNEVLTAADETKIKFYDDLFEAIARCGWVADYGVEDNDYLNQMLQNNHYYLTTMTENENYDDSVIESHNNSKYNFDTDIASNCDNIFMVNDQSIRDAALSDYTYEKSIINAKESRIDTRMKNLETEQSSIIKMMESIEKVKGDNIETYFSIFS